MRGCEVLRCPPSRLLGTEVVRERLSPVRFRGLVARLTRGAPPMLPRNLEGDAAPREGFGTPEAGKFELLPLVLLIHPLCEETEALSPRARAPEQHPQEIINQHDLFPC